MAVAKDMTWIAVVLQARAEACAATVNGKIYVAGGEGTGGGLLSSIEVYNPASNAWSKAADLPINVTDLGCTAFGNSGFYMAGGWTLAGKILCDPPLHCLEHPAFLQKFYRSTRSLSKGKRGETEVNVPAALLPESPCDYLGASW